MQFKFSAPETITNSDMTEAASVLSARASDIFELVYLWLSPVRQLELCHGIDDAGEKSLLLLIMRENGEEAGTAWIDEETVRAQYPSLQLVSNALLPVSAPCEPVADDAWFEARDQQLKIRWSDELCSNVISREHAIHVALSYALAGAGEAWFEITAKDPLDDCIAGTEIDINRQIISLSSHFDDPKSGVGFGESFMVP